MAGQEPEPIHYYHAAFDEVGRGAIWGPIGVGGVVLAPGAVIAGLKETKTLKARHVPAFGQTIEEEALQACFAFATVQEIVQYGLEGAYGLAYRRVFNAMALQPGTPLVVDGRTNYFKGVPEVIAGEHEVQTIVRGDARYASLAAASVYAKWLLDQMLRELAKNYPEDYAVERNCGYATPESLDALDRLGPTDEHRPGFAPVARRLAGQLALWTDNEPTLEQLNIWDELAAGTVPHSSAVKPRVVQHTLWRPVQGELWTPGRSDDDQTR